MKRRRFRAVLLAGYLTAGTFMTQFLTLCNSAATAATTSSGILVDNNGYFLGIFQVCGAENWVLVDQNDVPIGPLQNQNDDLMYGCPVQRVPVAP